MRLKPAFTLTFLLLFACTSGGTRAAANRYDIKKMPLIYAVMGKVRTRYVNPKRVNPKKMLLRALNNIQRNIPEVIVREKNSSIVEIQVDRSKRNFDISAVESPWDLTAKMEKIFTFIEANLRPETERRNVEYAAVEGILETLDPHSNLMRPAFFRQLEIDTAGSFGGLGIEISICDGSLTIRRPMKHTPAWNTRMKYGRGFYRIEPPGQEAVLRKESGGWSASPVGSGHPGLKMEKRDTVVRLNAGDRIIRIENESTVNMTLEQAVQRLRGNPDTDVVIWIARDGWRKPRPFVIRRAQISVPSVSHHMLDENIGYIRISKFQATTLKEMVTALKVMNANNLSGLILDLRDNHGGLLDQAVRVADVFISSGTIVSTMGLAGVRRQELRARKATTLAPTVPLAVLVNEGSASASEIVSSTLKQLDRGVIIGNNTFGKGSVQVIFQTPGDTGLKLTVSQWFAPGNFTIQKVGLTPDIRTLPVHIEEKKHPIFYTAERRRRGERDYKAALKRSLEATPLETKPFASIHYLEKPIPDHARGFHCRFCGQTEDHEPPPNPDVFIKDSMIGFAERLLSAAGTSKRLNTLKKARRFFKEDQKIQEAKIEARFKEMGIDWSAGKKTEGSVDLETEVKLGKKGRVIGGQKLVITVKATNKGTSTAHRVRAETFSTNNRLKNLEFFLGKIPPGETKTATLEVQIPKGYPQQTDIVRFKFFEQFERSPKPVETRIRVIALKKPSFAYSYRLSEKANSNRNGLFEKGESLELTLTLKNTGQGPTQEAYAELNNQSGPALFVQKGRFKVESLRPGQSQSYRFTFDLKEIPKNDGLARIQINVQDCVMGTSIGERLVFKVWPKGTSLTRRSKQVTAKPDILKKGHDVFLYLCPHHECTPLARVRQPDTYAVAGKLNGWLMTKIEGRNAFLQSAHVIEKKEGIRSKLRIVPFWDVIPPEIKITGDKQVTDTEKIQIRGRASHPLGIADVYIRVSNLEKEILAKKVFYQSSKTAKRAPLLEFSSIVPLKEGKNIVEIVARVNERITTSEVIVILKTPVELEKASQ